MASLKTKVGVVVGGQIVTDTNFSVNVVNASNIILTITVPTTADTYLPFSPTGSGGTVAIGLCNGTCTTPTGTATLNIGVGPIIQGVTSASSFNESATPTLAPYDMISIFGVDFCSSGGTGCSSTQILSNAPSATTQQYGATLSPDAVSATQRLLTVTFYPHGSTTAIATAPLLFATNTQINAIVPAAVSSYTANGVDIVVSFGYGTGATLLKSATFHASIAAADPGVFTIGEDGEGSGAALSSTYSLDQQHQSGRYADRCSCGRRIPTRSCFTLRVWDCPPPPPPTPPVPTIPRWRRAIVKRRQAAAAIEAASTRPPAPR